MSDIALINPPQESEACLRMLSLAKGKLELIEVELSTSVIDRELYLQRIGAAIQLRTLVAEMTREYERRFKI